MEEFADPTSVLCQVVDCKQKISRGKTAKERSRLSNTEMTGRKCWRQMRLKTEDFLF
jgi:hypothetical protein